MTWRYEDFLPLFDWCFVCFRRRAELVPPSCLQTQHIERRSQARKAVRDKRVNLMATCLECHQGALANMKHHWQLAFKMISDPDSYESIEGLLDEWLPIKHLSRPAPNRVTVGEVAETFKSIIENPAGVRNMDQFLGVLTIFVVRHPLLTATLTTQWEIKWPARLNVSGIRSKRVEPKSVARLLARAMDEPGSAPDFGN